MRIRHIVACAALLLLGCFESHGRGDGPIGRDAGLIVPDGCEATSGTVFELICPETAPAGSMATVEVEHASGRCCSRGTGSLSVEALDSAGYAVSSAWSVCDCCDSCPCLSPTDRGSVQVRVWAGVNTVFSGTARCEILGVEDELCRPVPARPIAPAVLFDDQRFAASLVHEEPADCQCRAELRRSDPDASLALCDCGDGCDAVLTTYAASFEIDPLPDGRHSIQLGEETHELRVVDTDALFLPCRPIAADAIQVMGPYGTAPGPVFWWARVAVTQPLCCSPDGPDIAVRSASSGPGAIVLEPFTCTVEDCLCMNPEIRSADVWHNLGELAPGSYVVRAGDEVASFTVP